MKWYNKLLPTNEHQGYIALGLFLLIVILMFLDERVLEARMEMIGLIMIGWGCLSFYAAFYTNNQIVFVYLGPMLTRSWSQLFGKRVNKIINIGAGITSLFIGIVLLRSV